MTPPKQSITGWQPGPRFFAWHFGLSLVFASIALYLLENSSLDLWLADQWYALQGGQWAWRNHWLSYDLIHHYGKKVIQLIGLLALVLIFLSYYRPRLRNFRAPTAYVLMTMALVPAAIASFKRISPVPCPWDIQRYGGELPYLPTFDYQFAATTAGHCFPSGHASGGFILFALYFASLPYTRKPILKYLLPGIVVGWTFALGQQSRGAHFLSHDVWTMSICWLSALGLFLLLRPAGWPAPLLLPDAHSPFNSWVESTSLKERDPLMTDSAERVI